MLFEVNFKFSVVWNNIDSTLDGLFLSGFFFFLERCTVMQTRIQSVMQKVMCLIPVIWPETLGKYQMVMAIHRLKITKTQQLQRFNCTVNNIIMEPENKIYNLVVSSLSNVGTSTSCLVTMPNEALKATESDPATSKPTSFIIWFPLLPLSETSDLSS